MNAFLAQVILAARNRGTEGWVQILVFVVLAVLYALGSIVKSRGNKVEQEEESARKRERRPVSRPPVSPARQFLQQARRAVRSEQSRQFKPQEQAGRRQVMRPQAVADRERAPRRRVKTAEMPESSVAGPQLESGIEELPEFASQTLQKMQAQAQSLGVGARTPVAKDVSQPVLDYTDADELTRAILHYEILGRPLSLRHPRERIIGL